MNWHWKDRHADDESASEVLTGLAALAGMLLSTGVIAVILRLASGKW